MARIWRPRGQQDYWPLTTGLRTVGRIQRRIRCEFNRRWRRFTQIPSGLRSCPVETSCPSVRILNPLWRSSELRAFNLNWMKQKRTWNGKEFFVSNLWGWEQGGPGKERESVRLPNRESVRGGQRHHFSGWFALGVSIERISLASIALSGFTKPLLTSYSGLTNDSRQQIHSDCMPVRVRQDQAAVFAQKKLVLIWQSESGPHSAPTGFSCRRQNQIRNSKLEIRNKFEIVKSEGSKREVLEPSVFWTFSSFWTFGFVSSFDIRISSFPAVGPLEWKSVSVGKTLRGVKGAPSSRHLPKISATGS